MMVEKQSQLEMERGEPIDDSELLQLLRIADKLKSTASEYRRTRKEGNKRAEPHLLDGRQHPCGEFLLKGTRIEEGHRDYDIPAAFRISVKKMKNGRR
jgi:hypothetical protein